MMLAAFSLASCSSDDDNDVYEATELGGTWQKVYDEGVADAGMVQYTFHPQSANNGTVDIFTSDWAAGDTTVYRIYTITDAGHLQISPKPDDTSVALTVNCDIHRLTSTLMIWNKPVQESEVKNETGKSDIPFPCCHCTFAYSTGAELFRCGRGLSECH